MTFFEENPDALQFLQVSNSLQLYVTEIILESWFEWKQIDHTWEYPIATTNLAEFEWQLDHYLWEIWRP